MGSLSFLIGLTILGAPASAETVTVSASPRFSRLGLDDGLPQLSAYAIVQDQTGFIWVGTGDGLTRHDGYEFVTFRSDSILGDKTVSDSAITALLDNGDALWIGTGNGGLNRYDHTNQRFTVYRHDEKDPNSLGSNAVTALARDAQGVIWIGTKGGLNRYDPKADKFTRYPYDRTNPGSLSSNDVLSVFADDAGSVWVGTNAGLDRLDLTKRQFEHFTHSPSEPSSLASNTVTAVYRNVDGVWVGTDGGGLDLLDPNTRRFRHFVNDPDDPRSISDNRVRVIYEDDSKQLWIGTQGQLNKKVGRHFARYISDPNDPTTLPYPWVASIMQDSAGVLWVGTWGGGVGKLDLAAERVPLYRTGSVFAFEEDKPGVWWLGQHVNGLAHFDSRTGRLTRFKASTDEAVSIHALHEDRKGRLWLGTFGKGLRRFDPRTKTFTDYSKTTEEAGQLTADVIFDIHEAADGMLWLATWGTGLVKFDPDSAWANTYVSDPYDPESPSSSYIYTIHQDRKDPNVMWIGTANGGLNRVDKTAESFRSFRHDEKDPSSLSHDNVLTIHEDAAGTLWLGTYGGGLNKFDKTTGTVERYGTKDGLAHHFVFGILEDASGKLWLSTNKGLSRFDPKTSTFMNFDARDGLQGDEFSQGAYFKTSDGRFLFGGVRGFNAFDPGQLVGDPFVPPVRLTGFTISNRSVPLGQPLWMTPSVEIDYDQPIFSFEFAALSYAAPSKNRYAYRLQGLHDDWVETDRRFVTYSSLAPGDYEFQVRGANRHGLWNEEGAKIAINVEPPPWRTIWAYLIYGLIVLGVLYLLYRYQEQRVIRAKERSRLESAEKDLELAATVQQFFLPESKTIEAERFRLTGFYRPADQCGGDWWWYETLGNHKHWVLVGDVTGHGAGPAVLTAAVATALRVQRSAAAQIEQKLQTNGHRLDLSIPERLSVVSEEIAAVCGGQYHMTMSSLEIDETTGRIHFYGTGGLPVLCMPVNEKPKSVGAPGTPLGVSPFRLGEVEYEMHAGERVLIFTDGIPETELKGGNALGMRRCQQIMERTRDLPIEAASARIAAEVDALRHGPQDDDVTFVLLEWRS